jgi:hypothetical protein
MNGKAGDLEAAAPKGFSLRKPRRFAPGSFTGLLLLLSNRTGVVEKAPTNASQKRVILSPGWAKNLASARTRPFALSGLRVTSAMDFLTA